MEKSSEPRFFVTEIEMLIVMLFPYIFSYRGIIIISLLVSIIYLATKIKKYSEDKTKDKFNKVLQNAVDLSSYQIANKCKKFNVSHRINILPLSKRMCYPCCISLVNPLTKRPIKITSYLSVLSIRDLFRNTIFYFFSDLYKQTKRGVAAGVVYSLLHSIADSILGREKSKKNKIINLDNLHKKKFERAESKSDTGSNQKGDEEEEDRYVVSHPLVKIPKGDEFYKGFTDKENKKIHVDKNTELVMVENYGVNLLTHNKKNALNPKISYDPSLYS